MIVLSNITLVDRIKKFKKKYFFYQNFLLYCFFNVFKLIILDLKLFFYFFFDNIISQSNNKIKILS